jgi:hypothetical protein
MYHLIIRTHAVCEFGVDRYQFFSKVILPQGLTRDQALALKGEYCDAFMAKQIDLYFETSQTVEVK